MMGPLQWVLAAGLGVGTAQASEITTGTRGHAFNPVWSTDGKWLAFEINDYKETNDLFVVPIVGGTARTVPQKVKLPGAESSFSGGGAIATSPVWHPQGPLIFEGSVTGGSSRLYMLIPGRGAAAEIIKRHEVSGDLSWPAVNPAGTEAMFVSDATGSGDLYSYRWSDGSVTKVHGSKYTEMSPKYNDDGTKVAFTRKNRGGHDVFTLENGVARPRIGGNGDQSRPAWHKGDLVYFSNERGEQEWDILVSSGVGQKRTVAQDIRLPHRMTPSVTPDGDPPDRGWVVYGVSDPTKSGKLYCESLFDDQIYEIDTGLVASGEAAMAFVGGRWLLAFTALPAVGADWRQLHVIDITSHFE